MYLATKTIELIDEYIKKDQGSLYRQKLKEVLPHISDAYSSDDFPFRSHLGASMIGDPCMRKIWYSFRWHSIPKFDGRLIRLFNRGHLEEGRIIAALLMINVNVWQQDEKGNQFRISDCKNHFGGSGDGVGISIPDLDANTPALLEFKTSNERLFNKLSSSGVKKEKYVHYVQMSTYSYKMNIDHSLYICVNKNTDALHAEIVPADHTVARLNIDKADHIIFSKKAPEKLSKSPSWFECKFCEYREICHYKKEPERNCRTCVNSIPSDDGKWICGLTSNELSKMDQFNGCDKWHQIK